MESPSSRLFIIDGMSLLFRSFYAMGTRLTAPDGTPVGAVYGFLKILIKLLKEQHLTHLAVCWDLKEKTFRHEVYPLYKGNRGETPPEIIPQIGLIKVLLEAMGVPSFAIPGYEADDIAGSLAKYFEHFGDVFLVTADKDYMQIVNDRIFLFSLKKGDEYDVIGKEKVFDYFGVYPHQVIDLLALTGDSVDNIPGVKGIGDKTAAKLVHEFGSIENMYENLERVSNKRAKEALAANKEMASLSKYLVTIKIDIPLSISEDALRYSFVNLQQNSAVKPLLLDLKMNSLVKMVFGGMQEQEPVHGKVEVVQQGLSQGAASEGSDPVGQLLSPEAVTWQESALYKTVMTKEELQEVCAKITRPSQSFFSLDTETTGLDSIEDIPIGVSLCFSPTEIYYIPAHAEHLDSAAHGKTLFSTHPKGSLPTYSPQDVWTLLGDALKKRKALVVAHNLKFDLHQLTNVGVSLGDAPYACTMIAAWLCNPTEWGGFGLDALTLKNFQFKKIPTSALIGKETGRASMLEVPLEELGKYACEDALATYKLWEVYEAGLKAKPSLQTLFFDMEMPVLKIIYEMERTGVHIDVTYLKNLEHTLEARRADIEKQLFAQVGHEFKITSPKQLGEVLFDVLKVHEAVGFRGKLLRTTLGYKTDAAVLEQFAEHPAVGLVQQHRELSKLLSTYVVALPKLVKKSTGRLHTHFHQIGTVTGRLSSSEPNLQNVPVRTELGKKVRSAFCAPTSDRLMVSADYSQIELRVLAHLSQDDNMKKAFLSGLDIHRQTAAQIHGKSPEEVTPEERSQAKAINFGILYGMGPTRLAKEQKISLANAKLFIEKYFENFAQVKAYIDQARTRAYSEGVVSTYFGRLRPIPELQSKNPQEARFFENMAINSPIQGTAADIMKLGMIAVQKALREHKCQSKIVLQVHDELVLEVLKEELDVVQKLVKDALEHAVSFCVPMAVEVSAGPNWVEAK